MIRANPQTQALCSLYENFPRAYPYDRIDDSLVEITLPVYGVTAARCHKVAYDVRDKRTLVIIDGDIPWCGLPKNATQVAHETITELRADIARQRKLRFHELPPPYHHGLPELPIPLHRRFLLLPAGNALIMRYRPESYAGWYTMIQLEKSGGSYIDATFTQSGY